MHRFVVKVWSGNEPAVKLGSRRGRAIVKRDLVRMDFSDEWEMHR